MKKNSILFTVILVILAALALASCGPKSTTLDVTMNEYAFEPNTWEVPAGGKVTLNLSNAGTLDHEFVLMVLGKNATAPFNDDDETNVYWEHELAKGESASIEFTAPTEPGVYQVVCGTPGHLEQGMQGTLTVK
jgi:uncharacterized cupredoxin-like copper-binding protein